MQTIGGDTVGLSSRVGTPVVITNVVMVQGLFVGCCDFMSLQRLRSLEHLPSNIYVHIRMGTDWCAHGNFIMLGN